MFPFFPMFSTSLATMHFHFVLALDLFHRVNSNRLTISSYHRCGRLLSGRFQSLGYTTRQLYESTCCLWILWRVQPNGTYAFRTSWSRSSLRSSHESSRSCNDMLSIGLSIALSTVISFCSSFFVVDHILLAYNIADKMVLFEVIGT